MKRDSLPSHVLVHSVAENRKWANGYSSPSRHGGVSSCLKSPARDTKHVVTRPSGPPAWMLPPTNAAYCRRVGAVRQARLHVLSQTKPSNCSSIPHVAKARQGHRRLRRRHRETGPKPPSRAAGRDQLCAQTLPLPPFVAIICSAGGSVPRKDQETNSIQQSSVSNSVPTPIVERFAHARFMRGKSTANRCLGQTIFPERLLLLLVTTRCAWRSDLKGVGEYETSLTRSVRHGCIPQHNQTHQARRESQPHLRLSTWETKNH